MMKEQLVRSLEYKKWANSLFFDSCAVLTLEQLQAPHPIKFGNLERTLQHVLDMDIVWKAHISGQPHSIDSRTPDGALPLDQLGAVQEEIDNWFIGHADDLEDSKFDELVFFDFLDGQPGQMTRADILSHVVNHGTYHRGHVAAMLYHFGVTPPTTDMPVFFKR